jgi:ATP/ADP translocase
MRSLRAWLYRIWDIRAGEGLAAVLAFMVLLLVISAHTIVETARDALLLTKLPARELGYVYIGVAVCALPGAAVAGHAAKRFGPRLALVGTLIASAALTLVFFALPASRASVVGLYVGSALIATTVVPQFWTLLGAGLTVAQASRLFGPIASAGVLGAVLGSGAAAAALMWMRLKGLLLGSGCLFLVAAAVVVFFPIAERREAATARPARARISVADVRQEPFLLRVGLIVAVSTAAVLAVDYYFKWTVARNMAPAHIGTFVARFYAALNVASLIVQLFVGAALVRRVGLAAAIIVTPLFVVLGAVGALVFGGALLAVLAMKAADGSLRYSLHRITTELLYLPVSPGLRERAKPIIDGAVVRASQAVTAALLLALGSTTLLSPPLFATIVVVLGVSWAAIAFAIRVPYLDLLRGAVSIGAVDRSLAPDPLDLASAEVLVEYLSSADPLEVVAAMNTLARRGHARLVPALILYHHDERVLMRSLEILSASTRSDWVTLARTLLDHPSAELRMAVARALAARGGLDLEQLALDASPRVQGYAALMLALNDRPTDLLTHPRIKAVLEQPNPEGREARLGLLAAIADVDAAEPLADLSFQLSTREPDSGGEWVDLVARAAARHGDERLVPWLAAHLTARASREPLRAALVALGEPAFDYTWTALSAGALDRRLRVHLPGTLAAFRNKRAAERLLENIESETDGLVRYKSVRALGRVVVYGGVRVSRQRVEALVQANLIEHLQVLSRRVALEGGEIGSRLENGSLAAMTGRLLRGLLDDKLRHSLERAFRLLKIAHPREDIHRVYIACQSNDPRARANAGELLNALLTRRDQRVLRELLRLLVDDVAPAERVVRSASSLALTVPRTHDAALLQLIDDHDLAIAALAALYASGIGTPPLRTAVEAARARRRQIEVTATRWFGQPVTARVDEAVHG